LNPRIVGFCVQLQLKQWIFKFKTVRIQLSSKTMLSESTHKLIIISTKIFCCIPSGPYFYQQKKLYYSRDFSHRLRFFLVTAFVVFHFFFVLFRSVQSVLYLNASAPTFLLQLAIVGQAGTSISMQLNTFFRAPELLDHFNALLQVDGELTSMWIKYKA